MNRLDQYTGIVGRDILVYTMPQIKDMPLALTESGKNISDFLFDSLRRGIEQRGIHIALQGNCIAYALTSLADIGIPVQPHGVATSLRYPLQPLSAAFGK